MNLKKHQSHLNLLMIQAKKNRSLKKHQESLQRQEKKPPKSPEFIESSEEEEEEEPPMGDKGPLLLGGEGRNRKFF